MKKIIFSILCFLIICNCFSQTNVRAWYADGQVFIVWVVDQPFEESYEIYAGLNEFTNTNDAFLVGRPLVLEYFAVALQENLRDSTATYRIPDGNGSYYQLALNEGLFVYTTRFSGSLYFAVTKVGENNIVPNENITADGVSLIYDPVNDPVECHLQQTFPSPFASDFVCFAYSMWAEGRQNHMDNRPDFPIMANAAKNGMPGLFLVSAPIDLDTTSAFPLSIWLHGGGGSARQSLAGSRKSIDINPSEGILLAHNDRLYGYRGITPPHPDQQSWHFGWGKHYNPFISNTLPLDTVVNYTQRKYLWIDEWLAKHFNIDTNRINIHGHSLGSAGSLALGKCFPERYGSVTLFNTGCAGPIAESNVSYILGAKENNFPTNLKNRDFESVRLYDLYDLYTNCSPHRDFPLIRHWHGKNDDNSTMKWSPVVVENYRICDSLGIGIQNFWSERPHGVDKASEFNDHWIKDTPEPKQTRVDNVGFAEMYYRNDESYPAFFNHRLDEKNKNPGTGLIGIDNGDGDNWGTWGGYHRWENIEESTQQWQAEVWLEGDAIFPNDNSPFDFLTADMAIRKPKQFKPATGETIYWTVEDIESGNIIQADSTVVRMDNLVVIDKVDIFKETVLKALITITLNPTSTTSTAKENSLVQLIPNPTNGLIYTEKDWSSVKIRTVDGNVLNHISTNTISNILDVSSLSSGIYFLEIVTIDKKRKVGKLIKL